jgi:hypothetical protein
MAQFPGFYSLRDPFSSDYTGQDTIIPSDVPSIQDTGFLPPGTESQGYGPGNLEDIIFNAAQKTGIPFDTAMNLVKTESGFNPGAVGPANHTGERATGLTQLLPSTAEEQANKIGYGDFSLTNPQDNAALGLSYLNRMRNRFGGDMRLGLEAYNTGPGNVGPGGSTNPNVIAYANKILGGPSFLPANTSGLGAVNPAPADTVTDTSQSPIALFLPDAATSYPTQDVAPFALNASTEPSPIAASVPDIATLFPPLPSDNPKNDAVASVSMPDNAGPLSVYNTPAKPTDANIAAAPTASKLNQDARQAAIAALTGRASTYDALALAGRKQALAPASLTGGETITAALMPFLGALVGGALNGRKGAISGGAAGSAGGLAGLKVAEGEAAKRQALSAEQAKFDQTEAERARADAFKLQAAGLQNQEKNANPGGQGNRQLSQDELEGFRSQLRPDLSLSQFAAQYPTAGDIQKLISVKKMNETQSRYVGTASERALKLAADAQKRSPETVLSVPLKDSQGNPMQMEATQKKNVTDLNSGVGTILENADALQAELGKYGRFALGDHAAEMKQFIWNMMPAMRQLNGQGVRFNQFIRGGDMAQIGTSIAYDQGIVDSLASSLFQEATGQDGAAAVQRFATEISGQYARRLLANGQIYDPDIAKKNEPDIAALLAKYNRSLASKNTDTASLDSSATGAGSPLPPSRQIAPPTSTPPSGAVFYQPGADGKLYWVGRDGKAISEAY